ncbi:MAG: type VI secretion system baseplate subunit TssK [Bryobacterales bacterium]|nr:type VI secretion system baseplate subunit TssK [Bryobacterales bacterium]
MKHLRRVVWSEGMHLGPHHFQAQSRYFEDLVQFAASALWGHSYGLAGYSLDGEALRNGTVSLLHARGILPDGLPFHMPECDAAPEPRNITDSFPPTRDSVTVLLAIAARKPNGRNCSLPEMGPEAETRYRAEARSFHDETTGRDEKAVDLGRKNFTLLLDVEETEGLLTLPIARVRRSGTGHFEFDASFIPPCTAIGASEQLMMMLRRLIDILEDKSNALSTAGGRAWSEYSTRDIANFWLLHTVNSALAPLQQIFAARQTHPEELFGQMLQLAGALCTFALDSHPRDLPLYDHMHLDECFGRLDHHIRTHLETVAPTNVISIPLRRTSDYYYEADIVDQRCLDRARWVFSIRAPLGEVEVISRTPALVKVCSKLFVPKLVERALPGMTLTHLPVPPSSISVRVDVQYFSISRAGPCWDHIVQSRQVGVYVPGDLPEPEMELLVILES